ncbi:hypothetical protein GCM10027418_19130 [Mariniluteicoccus endophyticus]
MWVMLVMVDDEDHGLAGLGSAARGRRMRLAYEVCQGRLDVCDPRAQNRYKRGSDTPDAGPD